MTFIGWLQIAAYALVIVLVAKPLGTFLYKVFTGQKHILTPVLGWLETLIYKVGGVDKDEDMPWTVYAVAMLAFSVVSLLITYALLRWQGHLWLNPEGFGKSVQAASVNGNATNMTPDLAFNTAVSFTTNTNWQSYSGENTMSYFSQTVALASHNFFSAASGIAISVALVRGLALRSGKGIGSWWVDLTRAMVYVLLPICTVLALFYVQQGMPQNFNPYKTVTTLEGATQYIPGGAVASQEAIKMLGTNGGGIFNANSAHPYENPTPLTNFVEIITIFLIGASLVYMFGLYVGNVKQGWAIFGAMSVMWFIGVAVCYSNEAGGNPLFTSAILQHSSQLGDSGGNMEGKELRFGEAESTLFATVTTDASCGAINCWHDSFTPLGGLVPMANILTGEVIFGGVGAGLYGMLMYAILAVFIAGLMVGRTPEYLGKKIESFEVKMAMLACLVLVADVLVFTGVACVTHVFHPATYWNAVPGSPSPTVNVLANGNTNNSGPHGFSEILYAFDSCTGNNGSAFGGLSTNTPFWNLMLGCSMLVGRFLMIVPLIAIAGSMAVKKRVPVSAGTFPTDNSLFAGLLVGTVIIVGALSYFPAVALGPVVEHFLMHAGKTF
jgi:K+-transporting ATPase ATPase A chain